VVQKQILESLNSTHPISPRILTSINSDTAEVSEDNIFGYLLPLYEQVQNELFSEIIDDRNLVSRLDHTFHTVVINSFDFRETITNHPRKTTKTIIYEESFKIDKIINTYVQIFNHWRVIGVDIKDLRKRLKKKIRQCLRKTSQKYTQRNLTLS
jgi:hypothetical protein